MVLVDDDGSSLTKSLDVTVADDTVNAEDDGPFTVTEDAGEGELSVISGNVLDNDLHANGEPGADRPQLCWLDDPAEHLDAVRDLGAGSRWQLQLRAG